MIEWGDPVNAPYWQGAMERKLLVQRCKSCGEYQLYGRPFCTKCSSDAVEWIDAAGAGTIYSLSTVRRPMIPGFEPPYIVALVDLDEGPRLMTNILNGNAAIGDRVQLEWRERENAPPLPVFRTTANNPA